MCFSVPEDCASPLLALKESEKQLVEKIEDCLYSQYPEEYQLVKERFKCLKHLGEAICEYPSVKASEVLRGVRRDEAGLIRTLSHFASVSYLFHMPTRVLAARTFLVAKFHAFSLLCRLVQDKECFHKPLKDILFSIICTLMSEEVYLSCLEDPSFPQEVRVGLAHDLIALWESGRDPRGSNHIRALETLWAVRNRTHPTFGTMEGSSELVRISMDLDDCWQDFLTTELCYNETKWALEEFLFGLSYEEIGMIRAWLQRFGISAIGRSEVHSYLERSAYGLVDDADTDPRIIYNFFIERRDAADFRNRFASPGPKKTLEEIYLKYLIAGGYSPTR
ncbi:MAG: hypothetical protein LBG73_10305 [Spirochaetaceae bacterium]|jgi:hypothetical protein|nr:hypothetical protein [Spirochaetaceae bacterium]